MPNSTRDPRSEAEKAIADLKRNAEMDMSLTESRSSVSPRSRPTPSASTTSRRACARATIRASRLAASFPTTAGHAAPGPRRLERNPITWGRIGGGEVAGALGWRPTVPPVGAQ